MAPRLLLVPSLVLFVGALVAEDAVTPPPNPPAAETLTVESKTESGGATGTKTDTPPHTQPQSISVVDAAFIREQHAIKLEEAIRNVAGVTVGGYYNDWDYFRIRGFSAGDNTRQDGLFTAPGYWITPDVSGAETVEVLKGPASMLYGKSALGGLVNIVSKKPKADEFSNVLISAGSRDFVELGVDAGTSFGGDEFGVRLVGTSRTRGSFVDGVDDSQRLYLAPSFTWWAGDNTTLTLLGHYQKDDLNAAWPLPASGFITSNPNGDLPISRNVGEPGFQNQVKNERKVLGYELAHRFNERMALRQNLRVSKVDEDFQGIYPQLLNPDGTLDRMVYTSVGDFMLAQADTMVDLRIDTGPLRHDVLVGLDLMYSRYDAFGQYASIDPLDIFNPVYGATPGALTPYTDSRTTTRTIGVYLQDQVTIAEHLTITAGMRWDNIDDEVDEALTNSTSTSEDSALTWRVGVAYQFHPVASAFASYSTSFTPQPYNTDVNGDIVDPEAGNQIETGVRAIDPQGRYQTTVAVFQITRQDVATADLNNPGASIITGEQRSRGVEFDGEVRPTSGWSLIGTYAYIDAEITEDNSLPVGDHLAGVPEHSATAWVKYTLQDTVLRGLGIGLGGRWYSEQAGDLPNTFELPAYTVIDAGLFYERGPLSAQLNVYNLLDKEYAVGSYDDLYVMPGDPLTLRATVAYTF